MAIVVCDPPPYLEVRRAGPERLHVIRHTASDRAEQDIEQKHAAIDAAESSESEVGT